MFSKRHYEWLARWCKREIEISCADDLALNAVYSLTDALEKNDPRFDRAKFLKACGVL